MRDPNLKFYNTVFTPGPALFADIGDDMREAQKKADKLPEKRGCFCKKEFPYLDSDLMEEKYKENNYFGTNFHDFEYRYTVQVEELETSKYSIEIFRQIREAGIGKNTVLAAGTQIRVDFKCKCCDHWRTMRTLVFPFYANKTSEEWKNKLSWVIEDNGGELVSILGTRNQAKDRKVKQEGKTLFRPGLAASECEMKTRKISKKSGNENVELILTAPEGKMKLEFDFEDQVIVLKEDTFQKQEVKF